MAKSMFFIIFLCLFVILHATISGFASESYSLVPEFLQKSSEAVVLIVPSDDKGSAIGQGSGFFSSPLGYIVTNYHVIAKATAIMVKLSNGAYYEIEGITSIDCDGDLAILKARSSGAQFPYLLIGDSKTAKVGERVLAIGSPHALEGTVSEGIISAIRHSEKTKSDILQTTAPVSPGSSGGPLLNYKGEVIGVVNASLLRAQNINFAIPSDRLNGHLYPRAPRPIEEMSTMCTVTAMHSSTPTTVSLSGTYTGLWKSRSGASGNAAVKIAVLDESATAWISLTGSRVEGEELSGKVVDFGEGVWTVNLRGKNLPLVVKGIFKEGTLTGDFQFGRDHGQYILKK